LKIIEERGHVRIYKGGPPYVVSLTPEGKTAYDNPEPRILFLSHAAMDEEISKYLKQVIEETFPRVDVFVSSDPEDLRPGDPWVETILQKLGVANVVIMLATDRGLSRNWVWFETGAGWASERRILSCCLGKQRKGGLPAPFSLYQALNIDEEKDCQALFGLLEKHFGKPSQEPDHPSIVSNLSRLDVRAELRQEERERLEKTTPYASEMKAEVESGLEKLSEAEKEAIRLLFVEGEVTDKRAVQVVTQRELLKGSVGSVFQHITSETNFVQRILPYHDSERTYGYTGPWRINPHLKPILESYLFPRMKS
jgi:hypothetical protein